MGQRKRILYIEDETDLQWLVKQILESLGNFEVVVCSSGAEGFRRMDDFAPDLVLLDVMMPVMGKPFEPVHLVEQLRGHVGGLLTA